MEEPLVSFDVASLLKEKGFDWKTFNYFNSERDLVTPDEYEVEFYPHNPINHNLQDYNWSRPSQSLAQKWLREVHGILLFVLPNYEGKWGYGILMKNKYHTQSNRFELDEIIGSYEEALEVGLSNALTLINNK